MDIIHLNDWMTTPNIKIGTKITSTDEDAVYHSHAFYEIFYITEGSIKHYYDGQSETLETGDIVFLRLNDAHKFIREHGKPCGHRDIVISEDQYKKSCDYIDPSLLSKLKLLPKPFKTKIDFERIKHFEKAIDKIFNVPMSEIELKKKFINIFLIDLLKIFVEDEIKNTLNYPAWLNDLISRFHMSQHLKSGLVEIVKPYSFNESYMCRVFKKYMGVTMSQYLCQTRLAYAANLLQFSDAKIATIALDVGFASVSYFNTQFEKQFKCTPKVFRKAQRKNDSSKIYSHETE